MRQKAKKPAKKVFRKKAKAPMLALLFVVLFVGSFIGGALTLVGCAEISGRIDQREKPDGNKAERNDFADQKTDQQKIDEQKSANQTPMPAPNPTHEKRLAVILGPGGYKAFAHTGVIKELRRASIPIQKVVGIEWGALIGALYAHRGQINEAEWKLYKLEKLDLNQRGFFGGRAKMQSLSVLDGFLHENLNIKSVHDMAIPFTCPTLNFVQGTVGWLNDDISNKNIEECLGYPPLFKPEDDLAAGMFSIEEAIQRLKNEGFSIIVLVNVLGSGNIFDNSVVKDDYAAQILWSEARRSLWKAKGLATDIIDVPTNGIAISDFESRKLLVTAGEVAGEKAAKILAGKYGF